MTNFWRVVVLFIIIFAAYNAYADPPKVDVPEPVVVEEKFDVKTADRSVVRITNLKGEFVATGFYAGNDTIVTNYHVVEGNEHMLVWNEYKQVALGTVKYTDQKQDVATMTLSNNKLNLKAVTFSTDRPARGETVYMVGAPAGLDWSLSIGYVMRKPGTWEVKDMVVGLVSMAGTGGSSGSPIFDHKGHVIGVTSMMFRIGDGLMYIPNHMFVKKIELEPAE